MSYRSRSPPKTILIFIDITYVKEVSMNDKLIKKLSKSCLFATCPDAKRCKRICRNRCLTKVFSRKAKILCMHELVEKEPVFYQMNKLRSKS